MNTDENNNNNNNENKSFKSKIADFLSKFKKKKEKDIKEENDFSNYYGNSSSNYYDSNDSTNYYGNSSNSYSSNSNYYDNNSLNNYYDNDSSNSSYYNNDNNNNSSNSSYYNNDNNNLNKNDGFNDYYNSSNNDYYSRMNNYDFNASNENEEKLKKIPLNKKKLLIVIGLFIILLVFSILLFRGCQNNVEIKLSDYTITLKVGESKYLSYEIINTDEIILATFSSSNTSVATVDETGKVSGVSDGNATIILSYKSGLFKKQEKCEVTVTSGEKKNNNVSNIDNNTKIPPTLSLSLANSTQSGWVRGNATINISAKSNSSSTVSLKYAINCKTNCKYMSFSGNLITIRDNGSNLVTVVAKDNSNGLETTKSITVNIDNTPPIVTLVPNQSVIKSTKSGVEVCAVCTDRDSGCIEAKTCKRYTSSVSNQTITVKDNVGNTSSTKQFNVVVINAIPPSCRLSLEGNVVTATTSNAVRYSFDSNFRNQSRDYQIPELKRPGSETITVNYYVMNNSGDIATCSINVLESCSCRYTDSKGNCYKTQSRVVRYRNSNGNITGKCTGATKIEGDICYWYTNPGYVCTYTKR